MLDHSCISALDVICHLHTPGRIILAMFLNVKCCCLCVHHHSYQANSNKQCMYMPWFQIEELPTSKRFHHCENDACPSDKCRHHGRRIVKGPNDHLHSNRGLMASCGLWPPVAYGLLWLMAPCGLWAPVAYGPLWLMASCGLWPPVAYGPL